MDALLRDCAAEGVSVTVTDGRLIVQGVRGAVDKWKPTLQANKGALLAYLATDGAAVRAARLALFAARGVWGIDADDLALRLARRDDQRDGRRVCLECAHLSGTASARRCSQWRKTGMQGPPTPAELVATLQRCAGFAAQLDNENKGTP